MEIRCEKGLNLAYDRKNEVFRVNYQVCGPCARTIVEVKLATTVSTK
jgi:hypothetical protein